jgi:hypothetical protein
MSGHRKKDDFMALKERNRVGAIKHYFDEAHEGSIERRRETTFAANRSMEQSSKTNC